MLHRRIYCFFKKHDYLIKFNFMGFISGVGYFLGAESTSIIAPFLTENRAYISLSTILIGELLSALFYTIGFYYLFKANYKTFVKSIHDALKHLWTNIIPIVISQIVFFTAHFHLQGLMHASLATPISGLSAFVTFNLVRNLLFRFYPMPKRLKIVKKFIKISKTPVEYGRRIWKSSKRHSVRISNSRTGAALYPARNRKVHRHNQLKEV